LIKTGTESVSSGIIEPATETRTGFSTPANATRHQLQLLHLVQTFTGKNDFICLAANYQFLLFWMFFH
jgi:hypothetical protein